MTLISRSTWDADTVIILSIILPLRLINRSQSSVELTVDFFTSLKDQSVFLFVVRDTGETLGKAGLKTDLY